jgi:glycolate oxidase iron-sulfur subunit
MSEVTGLGNFHPVDAPRYESILQCMRCGFCLAVCPTYSLTNRERSSPRGRAALARAVAEKNLAFTGALKNEAFFCLDCRACTTACPSGVQVGPIMEYCRGQSQAFFPPGAIAGGLRNFILKKMLSSPSLMETSVLPLRLYQRLGLQWTMHHLGLKKWLPGVLQKMEGILPPVQRPLRHRLPNKIQAQGQKRGRVAFFLGCAMNLFFADVSWRTAHILARQGFEVVTPMQAKCCGAPHLAEGERQTARELALFNLDLFLAAEADFIVTDCAGCGCALKDYSELLEGIADKGRLREFHTRIRDISELLVEVGLRTEALAALPASVTYHDPCHLAHGQGVSVQPRQVIQCIPGVEYRELKEANWCCGMAGSFALRELETSQKILDRKLCNVGATEADILVTSNPGCQLQLTWGVREAAMKQKVMHISELLGRSLGL